ncbi:dysbindin protein homolog isoform X2 [Ornithodoros turicata]|uniref:dysbindin protein homolog isoform X2 n=1 Tax=Ornithodoros turicata TaxID=34597 RepID=UPI003139869B
MLENLREKFYSVQQDLTESLRNFTLGEASAQKHKLEHDYERRLTNAGAELLHYYQSTWEEIHNGNEENAKKAEEVDTLIDTMHCQFHQQLSWMQQLNQQLGQLPKLQQNVQDLMKTIGELEGLFEEVELHLVGLEDIIETQALQERQLDERFKLALYKEKKMAHFEELRDKLEEDHQLRLQQVEEHERHILQERQQTFDEVFRNDLELYKAQGKIERIPANSNKQAALEEIDLEGDEQAQAALNEFLEDTDPPLSAV